MGEDDDPGPGPTRRGLTRRRFLGLIGSGAAAATVAGCDPLPGLPAPPPPALTNSLTQTALVLRRREDLLRLTIRLQNLHVQRYRGGLVLRPRPFGKPGLVIVDLGPQSTAEQGSLETKPAGTIPLGSRLSGPSRLVFRLKEGTTEVPFTLDGLLDWDRLQLVRRTGPPTGPIAPAPALDETAIEVPWELVLQPTSTHVWRHRTDLGFEGIEGHRELWRTELTDAPTTFGDLTARLRAIWTTFSLSNQPTDATVTEPGRPYPTMSHSNRDRRDIVALTYPGQDSTIDVEHLSLSALGASADLSGEWQLSAGEFNWHHIATTGREQYTRIERSGWLLPWGHRARKITITERKFLLVDGKRRAELRQRTFIVITQRNRRYADGEAAAYPSQGRDLPFRSVECVTRVTPLFDPSTPAVPGKPGLSIPRVGGRAYQADFVGTDWAGRRIPFTAPFAFVDATEPNPLDAVALAAAAILRGADPGQPQLTGESSDWPAVAIRPLHAGLLAIAEPTEVGSTDVVAREISVGVHVGTLQQPQTGTADAPFVPYLVAAAGQVAQTADLPSNAGTSPDPVTFRYFPEYVSSGFGRSKSNPGQVFAMVEGAALDLAETTAGGLVNGSFGASGLSRTAGVLVGDLDKIRQGTFDPSDLLADAPKLLGVVSLPQLFALAGITDGAELPSAPDDALRVTTVRSDDGVETLLRWTPTIKQLDGVFQTRTSGADRSSFVLELRSRTSASDPGASSFDLEAELRNVTIDLLHAPSFLVIPVHRLRFTSGSGRASDVDVDLGEIEFGEALAFVKGLTEFIPNGSGGLSLDVDTTGITAGISLALPNLQVGIFAMQNLSIGLEARIPFVDEPLGLRAWFSSRDDPFLLTVSMCGGGGWVGIELTADEVTSIEVGLEFGAQIALDVGVATGSVSLTAGIYIEMGTDDQGRRSTILEGFVKLCGRVEVLCVVTVTVEFNMALRFIPLSNSTGKVQGRATLIVEVDVTLFSKSVEITVERTFSNDPKDPTFRDLVPPRPGGVDDGSAAWDDYCNAFAPEEAA